MDTEPYQSLTTRPPLSVNSSLPLRSSPFHFAAIPFRYALPIKAEPQCPYMRSHTHAYTHNTSGIIHAFHSALPRHLPHHQAVSVKNSPSCSRGAVEVSWTPRHRPLQRQAGTAYMQTHPPHTRETPWRGNPCTETMTWHHPRCSHPGL